MTTPSCSTHCNKAADGYVIKPFNSHTVLGTLRRLRQGFAVSQPATLNTPN